MTSIASATSSLTELWTLFSSKPALEEKKDLPEVEDSGCIMSSLRCISKKVNWFIENRGGLAFLTGLVMVPSQCTSPNAVASNEVLDLAEHSLEFRLEKFRLPVEGGTSISGVIYYPEGWNASDSRCILYHNPNGITVAGYFPCGSLEWTPGEFMKIAKCPVIMYDYRGTGLSTENYSYSSIGFNPTYESVVVDGEAALRYALTKFTAVSVVGSSLGGGVATIALDRHLNRNPADVNRVTLLSHDSFSTTPKVVMPNMPQFANWAGWAIGGLMDAETSIKRLIKRGVSIMILCHTKDPVIPEGARMAEFVETLEKTDKVTVIYSPLQGHANLSPDMIHQMGKA